MKPISLKRKWIKDIEDHLIKPFDNPWYFAGIMKIPDPFEFNIPHLHRGRESLFKYPDYDTEKQRHDFIKIIRTSPCTTRIYKTYKSYNKNDIFIHFRVGQCSDCLKIFWVINEIYNRYHYSV